MNIYKVEFQDSSTEVVTAESRETVSQRMSQDEISEVTDCGPYLSDGAYQAIRQELL